MSFTGHWNEPAVRSAWDDGYRHGREAAEEDAVEALADARDDGRCGIWHDLFGLCERPAGHKGQHSRLAGGATEPNRWVDGEVRLVRWVDAAHKEGWFDPDEELEGFGVSECEIVGFVVREDDREVLLAQSVDTRHGRIDAVMAIPKVAIISQCRVGQVEAAYGGTSEKTWSSRIETVGVDVSHADKSGR